MRVRRIDVAAMSINDMMAAITGCINVKSRNMGCRGADAMVALAIVSSIATKLLTTPTVARITRKRTPS